MPRPADRVAAQNRHFDGNYAATNSTGSRTPDRHWRPSRSPPCAPEAPAPARARCRCSASCASARARRRRRVERSCAIALAVRPGPSPHGKSTPSGAFRSRRTLTRCSPTSRLHLRALSAKCSKRSRPRSHWIPCTPAAPRVAHSPLNASSKSRAVASDAPPRRRSLGPLAAHT
jgi:hypothetical protein